MKDALPRLKGAVARLLQVARPRHDLDQALDFEQRPMPMSVNTTADRAVVLMACMMLEHVRDSGGSRVSKSTLQQLIRQLSRGMTPEEIMHIEVELYEMFNWIAGAIHPDWAHQPENIPRSVFEDSSHLDVIRWAMHHGDDLYMEYYHPERGELTRRQVTPLHLRAETYLLGFCHLRMDERVFRLSRIGELRPASGWPVRRHEVKPMAPPDGFALSALDGGEPDDTKENPTQMSFFGEEE